MRNYVSSTFEKWYIAIYVMKLEKSHLTGPIRVVPELTPFKKSGQMVAMAFHVPQ